jgi:hypothetical protein
LGLWKRHRTIGIIEGAVEADIAILAWKAIAALPSALRCVVKTITEAVANSNLGLH